MSGHLAQFFVASMLIIIVPGPSVTFTIARAVAWGRAVAVLSVLGNTLGTLVLSLLVAFGLGPLLAHSKAFSVGLQLVGGLYLVYLGLGTYRHRHAAAEAMVRREGVRPNRLQVIRQGFTVGILNPKSLVFFAAVFPHFVDRASGHETEQLVVFGLIFCVLAFCSDGTWGVIAGTARQWLASSAGRLVGMRVVAAGVMCTLGSIIVTSAALS